MTKTLKKNKLYVILRVILLSVFALSSLVQANTIVIPKINSKAPVNIKHQKTVTLQGYLETIPYQGAMLTLQTREFGMVILFRPSRLTDIQSDKVDVLEAQRRPVNVTGNLLLFCSMKDLNAGVLGCRQFDERKSIKIDVLEY